MNTGLSYDLSVWLHFGGRVLIRLQIEGILHLYKVKYICYIYLIIINKKEKPL